MFLSGPTTASTSRRERASRFAATGALALGLACVGIVSTAGPAAAGQSACNFSQSSVRYEGAAIYTVGPMPAIHTGNNPDAYACYLAKGQGGTHAIQTLQRALNQCYGFSLTVDGIYGQQTANTVHYVQLTEGVGADGVFGNQTRWAMKWPISGPGYGAGACWKY